MRNPFYGLVAKRHYVVVEEANVLELLSALTHIHYADQNLIFFIFNFFFGRKSI